MQTLKDEVRERILKASLQEFYTVGYKQSSMRKIAQLAKVTPGNIYAYFDSKEDLLDQVLSPTVELLNTFIFEVSKGKKITNISIEQLTSAITQIFLENRFQFMILMNKSAGTKYQNIRTDITRLVQQRITSEMFPELAYVPKNNLLAQALATSTIEGIFCIFNIFGEDINLLNNSLGEFLSMTIRGFDKRT